MVDECRDLLHALLEARAPSGEPLLQGEMRERAGLCAEELAGSRERAAIDARFAGLGRLAGAVVHELMNPVAVLQADLELLPSRIGDLGVDGTALLAGSRAGIERISAALSALRTLIREEPPGPVEGDARRAAEAAVRLVSLRLSPLVRIDADLREVPKVPCGDGTLGQVVLHLLMRSLDAMGVEGGPIRLQCREDAGGVAIEVEHGGGVAADDLQLGFSLAQYLVERAGGQLESLPREGGGARYVVALPAARG